MKGLQPITKYFKRFQSYWNLMTDYLQRTDSGKYWNENMGARSAVGGVGVFLGPFWIPFTV